MGSGTEGGATAVASGEEGTVRVSVEAGVAVLTLDRPERHNTLTLHLARELGRQVAALGARDDVRVLVVRGAGEAAFCAGLDIAAIDPDEPVGADGMVEADRALDGAFRAIEACERPVIAAIGGHCIGGGFELAMACDLRVAAPRATFRMPPARLGWAYSLSGLDRFVSAVGAARARRLFLAGERLDAERAAAWGILDRVEADWLGTATTLAAGIAEAAPLALAGLKQGIAALARRPVAEADWERHVALRRRALASDDLRDARAAFLERRAPVFRGR